MSDYIVAVIGAGASGITACKALKEQGIDFECLEKGSFIGGLWKYENDNGLSSCYKSLHINTSRQMMAYSDFPMPSTYPDYPNHALIYEYFQGYAEHFGIREKIRFNTEVLKITALPGDRYLVKTNKGEKAYDAVIVCNGHHWNPKWATFPGEFTGRSMHSHDYKSFQGFEDKRVLVVGIGNSAVDIACELCKVASRTVISTRSGAYIMPKYLFGIPTDHLAGPPLPYLPVAIQRAVLGTVLLISRGDQRKYGIPRPNRALLHEHPTVSQELPSLVGHGKIAIKPNISSLNGDSVSFEDGTEEQFDVIIYATGYQISFPFLDDDLLQVKNNIVPLYHKVVPPARRNLFFLGLIQPLGPLMPLAEIQAKWVSRLLKGEVKLPDENAMNRAIENDRKEMVKRYGKSSRHTIQVDFYPYLSLIKNEMNHYKVRRGVFA